MECEGDWENPIEGTDWGLHRMSQREGSHRMPIVMNSNKKVKDSGMECLP